MKFFCLLAVLFPFFTSAQEPKAYQWFTGSGKAITFEKVSRQALTADLVFFGELHDDPIAHWMQLTLGQRMFAAYGTKTQFGAEMFERDQQVALNNFLSGKWDEKVLKDSTKMWSNFKTDYLPLLTFARDNKLSYTATNIPRPFASRVFKKGLASLDSLSAREKQWICPLPFPFDSTLSQYQELIKMGMEMHSSGINFALAQAVKDATMAYSILETWQPGNHYLHLNGAFHSDYYQGIMWYIQQSKPEMKIVTITTVTQDQLRKVDAEFLNKADFILVVPSTMTRTM